MKGDPKVIELLNEALKAELTAINQYWLHYRMLDNWGVHKLAAYERHESIDEMKHADRFAERILFLEGLPNFQMLGRLRIGETVEEILKADLEAEYEAAKMYREGVDYCDSVRDYVSRDLFAEVLRDEEGHIDFLETQFEMIARMGLQNYIQLNSNAAEAHG
jgi:bacterioferritin